MIQKALVITLTITLEAPELSDTGISLDEYVEEVLYDLDLSKLAEEELQIKSKIIKV